MIRVYYMSRDCGDGTSTVDFFLDREYAERLREEEEDFFMNESLDYFDVPDIGDIRIRTPEEDE